MRIDLHVHTSEWSDGKDCVADIIEQAMERGLDGMVISDHHRMLQPDEQAQLRERFPGFKVFRGAEISINRDHVNLIGGTGEQITAERPHDEAFLRDYTERTGAFSMLNHPFWKADHYTIDLDAFCPEGMDIISMNTDTARREVYLETARERRMALTAASDTHNARQVGLFHVDLDRDVDTDEELIEELRAGRLSISTFDDMMRERIDEVEKEEALARKVLDAGGSLEDYKALGGTFAYARLSGGGSYRPPDRLIGYRGDRFLGRS
ncbi:MAG: PHP-associated domain-containing protein [Candidatus Sumerlaeota bacterium]